jgi:hypothetical protein
VAHELGHHVLHKNPSSAIAELGLPAESREDKELRANQFATTWFRRTATPEQQERFFQKNRELNQNADDLMVTIAFTVLAAGLLYLFVSPFSKN